MKIIHVNLASGFRGGERQTVLLIQNLATLGHEQALVCCENSHMRSILKKVPKLVFINGSSFLSGHFSSFSADIVQAHEGKAVYWAFIHKLLFNTPYIITRRIPKPVSNSLKYRLTYNSASGIVAISNKIMQGLTHFPAPELRLIHSVASKQDVKHEVVTEVRRQFPNKIIIGNVAALVDRDKGQSTLLKTAEILQKTQPQCHFVFLGEGKDELALKESAKHLNNVSFLGFVTDVTSYISAFDIFAFPSRSEGLGSILLDVINCKVPIIATNIDGIPDIIQNEKTGILIPVDSPEILANSIVRYIKDPELVTRVTDNALDRMYIFSPEHMAENYNKLYMSVLKMDVNNHG